MEFRSPIVRRHAIWEEIDPAWALTFVGGLGIGIGLMFLLDPARGSHRRTKIKDAARHSMHKAGDAIAGISRMARGEERMDDRLDVH
ncbi:MAG: hypothetical protein J2P31_19435 [Blastocatellia bacterium]|nr:hypothetical protein [Blastocatellia bacterium]MBO0800996.1 hypothetical protein [Blastocatellia bacterium]